MVSLSPCRKTSGMEQLSMLLSGERRHGRSPSGMGGMRKRAAPSCIRLWFSFGLKTTIRSCAVRKADVLRHGHIFLPLELPSFLRHKRAGVGTLEALKESLAVREDRGRWFQRQRAVVHNDTSGQGPQKRRKIKNGCPCLREGKEAGAESTTYF